MDLTWWSGLLDQLRHAPLFPMWAAAAATAAFVLILAVVLVRADKSVANGALAVITLISLGLLGYSLMGGSIGLSGRARLAEAHPSATPVPALACIDDLAGDEVLAACERTLFSSPETIAAAVSYTSTRLDQIAAAADGADPAASSDMVRVRRSVERDRFGLVAHVLVAEHGCRPDACSQFGALGDSSRIAANMDNHLYEMSVARFAPTWNLPPPPATATALMTPREPPQDAPAATPVPAGRPNTIDYPTSSSIPPVNIMTPEPAAKPAASGAAKPPAAASASATQPAAAPPGAPPKAAPKAAPTAGHAAPSNAQALAKKPANPQAAAKKPQEPKPATPVQLAPEEANPDN